MPPVDSLLGVFLHRITKNLAPSDFSYEQSEAAYEELMHQIENDTGSDTYHSLEQIISEFQSKMSTNSIVQFQRNLANLLKYKDNNSVARYLFILKSLFNHDDNNISNNNNHSTLPIRQPQHLYDNFERNSFAGSEYQPSVRAQTIDSFENVHFDRFSDRRSTYSALPSKQNRFQSFRDLLAPYFENQVTEEEVLEYIPYTLAGTTSDILPVNNKEIQIPDNTTNGLSGELHMLLEVSLIYKELSSFIQQEKSVRNKSQTRVAALSFIQDQLDIYLGYVNKLTSSFALKSMYADLLDDLVKLRFLRFISLNLNSWSSHELLSTLFSYSTHGDETINHCSAEFLKYCVSTFSSAIFTWLLEGEIDESSEDFFIQNESPTGFIFRFHKDRLPTFFGFDLSSKVYDIGLTNRFLKQYCKETKWLNEYCDRLKALFQREKINSNENDIVLWNNANTYRLVSKLHNEIINHFNEIVYNKNHYFEIITALKDYLLMGKGDFIESLVVNGESVLNDPSNSLSGHQLGDMLRQAVSKTTSRHNIKKDSYILENLDARLLSIGHGNIGWDVFTLDYRVNPPLSIILSTEKNDFEKDYLRIFNHLWKIKRLDHLYLEAWKETRKFKNSFKDKKFRRFKLVQNFLHSFIKSIKSYILNDVIDHEYNTFVEKIKDQSENEPYELKRNNRNMVFLQKTLKPNKQYLQELNGSSMEFQNVSHGFNELTLDEMKSTHYEFLSSIINHKLINGSGSSSKGKISGKAYTNQLNTLINLAFKFILTMRELHSVKYDSQFSTTDIQMLRREGNIYDNLLKLFQGFNNDLKVFVTDLNNDEDIELRYLGASLNQ